MEGPGVALNYTAHLFSIQAKKLTRECGRNIRDAPLCRRRHSALSARWRWQNSVYFSYTRSPVGLDHGVGHSLLLLYDAKAPRGQKSKEFKGLGHYLSNTPYRIILYHNKIYYLYNYLIFLLILQVIEIKCVCK